MVVGGAVRCGAVVVGGGPGCCTFSYPAAGGKLRMAVATKSSVASTPGVIDVRSRRSEAVRGARRASIRRRAIASSAFNGPYCPALVTFARILV